MAHLASSGMFMNYLSTCSQQGMGVDIINPVSSIIKEAGAQKGYYIQGEDGDAWILPQVPDSRD